MKMVLEGIRVLEWGVFMQAPIAARILGSLGAEVIKLEQPGVGDRSRGVTEWRGLTLEMPDGRNAFYENHNRNKKGIAIDIKKPQGREIIYRLVEKSDIFVTNWLSEQAKGLGMDYDTLRKRNPRIIYGAGSGYGPRGPLANKGALDLLAQARGGLMLATGEPGSPPLMGIDGLADDIGAFSLASGLVAALYARDRWGIGQKVESSLLGTVIRSQRWFLENYYMTGFWPGRLDRKKQANPLYSQYECKDGRWIIFAELSSQRVWGDFCRAIGKPELETDARFQDELRRKENCEELISILDKVFASKAYDEWDKILDNFLHSPINKVTEVEFDPQVTENRYVTNFDDPIAGTLKVVGLPFELSETPSQDRSRAPELGEHTEEVLIDICGYTWDDIAAFQSQEVI